MRLLFARRCDQYAKITTVFQEAIPTHHGHWSTGGYFSSTGSGPRHGSKEGGAITTWLMFRARAVIYFDNEKQQCGAVKCILLWHKTHQLAFKRGYVGNVKWKWSAMKQLLGHYSLAPSNDKSSSTYAYLKLIFSSFWPLEWFCRPQIASGEVPPTDRTHVRRDNRHWLWVTAQRDLLRCRLSPLCSRLSTFVETNTTFHSDWNFFMCHFTV